MIKRKIRAISAMLLVLTLFAAVAFARQIPAEVNARVARIDADGSAVLDLPASSFHAMGYEAGDVISVIVGGTICSMPLVQSQADVNRGSMLALDRNGYVTLCVSGDNFSAVTGCAQGDAALVCLQSKGGYLSEMLVRSAVYSNLREPDYSDPACWAMFGMGENVPADVFLVCQTVDMAENGEPNMSLDNQRAKEAFYSSLLTETGIFDHSCRVFAPYYRQMTMPMYMSGYTHESDCFRRAYEDVSAAFAYYLENCGGERPIVLAGFSQGAEMVLQLLKDHFGDDALRERLVVAYVIGWRVTPGDLAEAPHLKMAQTAGDTGVIVSYNTETPWAARSLLVPEGVRALSINPLSWSTDSVPAGRELNAGACFFDENGMMVKETPNMTGAYIDPIRGTLKVTDVDETEYPPGFLFLGEGSYHPYDHQFFYRNLQQNAAQRVNSWLFARAQ